MEYLFYAAIALIMGLVIFLTLRAISSGLEARSELKRDGTIDKNKEDPYTFKSKVDDENDKILKKLKKKNLSPKDLKKMYEQIQKKK